MKQDSLHTVSVPYAEIWFIELKFHDLLHIMFLLYIYSPLEYLVLTSEHCEIVIKLRANIWNIY